MPQSRSRKERLRAARACPVEMFDGNACGRPIFQAEESADDAPVCLMHSEDPGKDAEAFEEELDLILDQAQTDGSVADFSWFVIPFMDGSNRTFAPKCRFRCATFVHDAVFEGSIFLADADFGQAKFHEGAFFQGATFCGSVDFSFAEFSKDALFGDAEFSSLGYFRGASFAGKTEFDCCVFHSNALFQDANFKGPATFDRTRILGRSTFSCATLCSRLTFRRVSLRRDFSSIPTINFTSVRIDNPESVEFRETDLGQAIFHNTDVSRIDFTQVSWFDRGRTQAYLRRKALYRLLGNLIRRKPKGRRMRWNLLARIGRRQTTRLAVFDEIADVKEGWAARELRRTGGSADERNYGVIAETYQQLKRNYDAKGDYWTAGHWHYGEMEMKRQHSRWRWKPLRWLSHHLSLVALYKYASAYGESYMMPLLWLFFFVSAFAFLYPIPGLEFNPPAGAAPGWLGYVDWSTFFHAHANEQPAWWWWKLPQFWSMILHSLMTSLSVAGFQRELRYAPSYPWGRMLALLELLLTTTLGGLFLLAIRRQFKRS